MSMAMQLGHYYGGQGTGFVTLQQQQQRYLELASRIDNDHIVGPTRPSMTTASSLPGSSNCFSTGVA